MDLKTKKTLRDLAKKYLEICNKEVMDERRQLWRSHNSLENVRTPILCSWHIFSNVEYYEMFVKDCVIEDPTLRAVENFLRDLIFHDLVNDDYIFEPWVTISAAVKPWEEIVSYFRVTNDGMRGLWGEERELKTSDKNRDAWQVVPIINNIEDISKKLKVIPHTIDEKLTNERFEKVQDYIGDILGVSVDRRPMLLYSWGGSDISTALGQMIGLERLFMYMVEKPELVHALAKFMRDGILQVFKQAEESGDWYPAETMNSNLGMSYSNTLPDPLCNKRGFKMKDLWFYTQAQEFTAVSPEMLEEFVLQYQSPIMEKFGLVSHGCCENQDDKMKVLRKIPNLRRVGLGPYGDVAKTAEQTGKDYVLSWRPKPAMVGAMYEPEYIRNELERGYKEAKKVGAILDIILKDITTINGDKNRLIEWTKIAKEVTGSFD